MKKTLVIMGSHPNGAKNFDWDRTDCDVWLFNEAPSDSKYKRCDAFFQLHTEAIWKNPKNRSDEKHYEWLASGKTPKVFMQKIFKDVPKSAKYPLTEVLELTKNIRLANGKVFKCLMSTPDLAMALVAQMHNKGKKYEKVEIWGIELETESEYRHQRLGFGFWTGYLAALGINLEIHNEIFSSPIYGYEGDLALSSADIQKRIDELTKNLEENYQANAKRLLEKIKGLEKKDISGEIQQALTSLTKNYEPFGIVSGQIKESKRYLEKAQAMEKEVGVSVFSLGEFDGTRISYSRQYTAERVEAERINAKLTVAMEKIIDLKPKSNKRKRAVEAFGPLMTELMNKNMLLLLIIGGIRENQYYIDTSNISIERSKNGN